MSTLSTYKTLVSQKLGTSGLGFFAEDMRTAAINEAVGDIYGAYDIPQLFKVATLTFASGKATIPSDYFRMIKVWDATDPTPEYMYLTEDQFDTQSATASPYWTEDYDTVSSTRKLFLKPTSVTSVRIRYVVRPTTLTTDSSDSLLPDDWNEAVAYKATSILANNAGKYDKHKSMEAQYESEVAKAYASVKGRGGVKGYSRLRSVYEKYHITGSSHPN